MHTHKHVGLDEVDRGSYGGCCQPSDHGGAQVCAWVVPHARLSHPQPLGLIIGRALRACQGRRSHLHPYPICLSLSALQARLPSPVSAVPNPASETAIPHATARLWQSNGRPVARRLLHPVPLILHPQHDTVNIQLKGGQGVLPLNEICRRTAPQKGPCQPTGLERPAPSRCAESRAGSS